MALLIETLFWVTLTWLKIVTNIKVSWIAHGYVIFTFMNSFLHYVWLSLFSFRNLLLLFYHIISLVLLQVSLFVHRFSPMCFSHVHARTMCFFSRHSAALRGVKGFRNTSEPLQRPSRLLISLRGCTAFLPVVFYEARWKSRLFLLKTHFFYSLFLPLLFPRSLCEHVAVYETRTQSPTQTQKIDARTFLRAWRTRMRIHSSINPSNIFLR